jgi:hypothetical protein
MPRTTAACLAIFVACALTGCPQEPYDPSKPPARDAGADADASGGSASGGQGVEAPDAAGQVVAAPETLSSGEGGTSPADVFFRMKAAVEVGDFGTYYDLLTPESRRNLLPMISVAAGLVATAEPQAMEELEALLDRHGLTEAAGAGPSGPRPEGDAGPAFDMEAMAAQFDGVDDPRGLFGELMGFVAARQPPQDVVALEDLTVDGDVGRGNKVVVGEDGSRFREPIGFRREADRWFVHVDAPQ